jgi:peptidoglycan/LPS O-acetylase OafA/YrhL
MNGDPLRVASSYRPQLDGLRALAVAAVITQHFDLARFGGDFGVHLFFVLSGFLITGILLDGREAIERQHVSRMHVLRQFYIRRFLRIFPLYYLVVIASILIGAAYARDYAPWLLSFTINIKMTLQRWYIGNFAHFWSLAVEEQFYLVWPWVILFLPRRRILPAVLIMIAMAPLFRLAIWLNWVYLNGPPIRMAIYIATPAALDALGIGSLIAVLSRQTSSSLLSDRRFTVVLPVVAAVVALVGLDYWSPAWSSVTRDTFQAIAFGGLIYGAAKGFAGITGDFLASRPLVYLGRISYGIYVYHPLVPKWTEGFAKLLGVRLTDNIYLLALLNAAVTVMAASVSWYAFEGPINRLKRYFAYVPETPAVSAAPVAAPVPTVA